MDEFKNFHINVLFGQKNARNDIEYVKGRRTTKDDRLS